MKTDNIKIKRKSMRDEAYNILQNLIIIGEFEPNKKLKDSELSEMLGISRTPIREALLRLEDDGLIETKANSWTMVSSINIEQAEHIYPIVEFLENLAIEQGIKNVTVSLINDLEKANEKFKKELNNNETEKAFQLDVKFHDMITKTSENEELTKILNNLKIKIKRIEVYYFEKQSSGFESYYEHIKIIENIKSRKLEKVKYSLSENWRSSLNRIRDKFNSEQT